MAIDVVSSPVHFSVKNVAGSPVTDRFEELVLALKDALGPSSGLTSDDVDVGYLTRLMAKYDSSSAEWSKYAFGDASRGYTRNLVDEGNGKSNLVSRRNQSSSSVSRPLRLTAWPNSLSSYGRRARAAPSMTMATPTAS